MTLSLCRLPLGTSFHLGSLAPQGVFWLKCPSRQTGLVHGAQGRREVHTDQTPSEGLAQSPGKESAGCLFLSRLSSFEVQVNGLPGRGVGPGSQAPPSVRTQRARSGPRPTGLLSPSLPARGSPMLPLLSPTGSQPPGRGAPARKPPTAREAACECPGAQGFRNTWPCFSDPLCPSLLEKPSFSVLQRHSRGWLSCGGLRTCRHACTRACTHTPWSRPICSPSLPPPHLGAHGRSGGRPPTLNRPQPALPPSA